jgi:hypothetical protein
LGDDRPGGVALDRAVVGRDLEVEEEAKGGLT